MTHLPRPTLRALRSVVARAYGVRRSRVCATAAHADAWLSINTGSLLAGRDKECHWMRRL